MDARIMLSTTSPRQSYIGMGKVKGKLSDRGQIFDVLCFERTTLPHVLRVCQQCRSYEVGMGEMSNDSTFVTEIPIWLF